MEIYHRNDNDGYEDKFFVDFYGKIDEKYEAYFYKGIENLKNVNYCGFLDLHKHNGYDTLSQYDIFIFPTYWRGEGFAGVLIDAFISGLPMIITDWAHNREFVSEGKTALFIPVHNIIALSQKMKDCIDKKIDIYTMSLNCQEQAKKYDIDNVITTELLEEIGVL